MWRHLVWAPEDGQVDVDGWAPYTPLPQSKLGATWSDAGEGDSDLSKAVGLVLYPLCLPLLIYRWSDERALLGVQTEVIRYEGECVCVKDIIKAFLL